MNLVNVEFKIKDLNYIRAHDFENHGLSQPKMTTRRF